MLLVPQYYLSEILVSDFQLDSPSCEGTSESAIRRPISIWFSSFFWIPLDCLTVFRNVLLKRYWSQWKRPIGLLANNVNAHFSWLHVVRSDFRNALRFYNVDEENCGTRNYGRQSKCVQSQVIPVDCHVIFGIITDIRLVERPQLSNREDVWRCNIGFGTSQRKIRRPSWL